MMKKIKKTVITVETVQRTTIRQRRTAKIALCDRCAAELREFPAAHVSNKCATASPSEIGALSDIEIEDEMLKDRSKLV